MGRAAPRDRSTVRCGDHRHPVRRTGVRRRHALVAGDGRRGDRGQDPPDLRGSRREAGGPERQRRARHAHRVRREAL